MATSVQSQARNGTLTGAFGSNVTSGNSVLLAFNGVSTNGGSGVKITGVSGGTGTTWTRLIYVNPDGGSFDYATDVWIGTGFSSAAMTITITVTGENSTSYSWTAVEYNGLDSTQISDLMWGRAGDAGTALNQALPRLTATNGGDAFWIACGAGSSYSGTSTLLEGSPNLETNAGTGSYHQRHYHKAVSRGDTIGAYLDQASNGNYTYLGFVLGPATDRYRVGTGPRSETTTSNTPISTELVKNDGTVVSAADDILLLYCFGRDSTGTFDSSCATSGWTLLSEHTQDHGTSTNDLGLAVYYKVAAGGDADPAPEVNDAGGGMICFTEIWRGFGVPGNPQTNGDGTNQAEHTAPSITTTNPESWTISVAGVADAGRTILDAPANYFWGGYYCNSNGTGQNKTLSWSFDPVESNGSTETGPKFQLTVNHPDPWIALTFELTGQAVTPPPDLDDLERPLTGMRAYLDGEEVDCDLIGRLGISSQGFTGYRQGSPHVCSIDLLVPWTHDYAKARDLLVVAEFPATDQYAAPPGVFDAYADDPDTGTTWSWVLFRGTIEDRKGVGPRQPVESRAIRCRFLGDDSNVLNRRYDTDSLGSGSYRGMIDDINTALDADEPKGGAGWQSFPNGTDGAQHIPATEDRQTLGAWLQPAGAGWGIWPTVEWVGWDGGVDLDLIKYRWRPSAWTQASQEDDNAYRDKTYLYDPWLIGFPDCGSSFDDSYYKVVVTGEDSGGSPTKGSAEYATGLLGRRSIRVSSYFDNHTDCATRAQGLIDMQMSETPNRIYGAEVWIDSYLKRCLDTAVGGPTGTGYTDGEAHAAAFGLLHSTRAGDLIEWWFPSLETNDWPADALELEDEWMELVGVDETGNTITRLTGRVLEWFPHSSWRVTFQCTPLNLGAGTAGTP